MARLELPGTRWKCSSPGPQPSSWARLQGTLPVTTRPDPGSLPTALRPRPSQLPQAGRPITPLRGHGRRRPSSHPEKRHLRPWTPAFPGGGRSPLRLGPPWSPRSAGPLSPPPVGPRSRVDTAPRSPARPGAAASPGPEAGARERPPRNSLDLAARRLTNSPAAASPTVTHADPSAPGLRARTLAPRDPALLVPAEPRRSLSPGCQLWAPTCGRLRGAGGSGRGPLFLGGGTRTSSERKHVLHVTGLTVRQAARAEP